MCRFNEEEYFPILNADDSEVGLKNFIFLFDYKLCDGKDSVAFLQELSDFYHVVRINNIRLSNSSKDWYAELRADFLYKKKIVELGIVMQYETAPTGLPCWQIVGVNGLEKIGYRDTTNRYAISPVQHESLFVELDDDFKRLTNEFSMFRGRNIELDALSYFFALVETGTLKFQGRVLTLFHFLDVPSYVFSVKYHARNIANTGWLISDYEHVSNEEKQVYLKQLLGK
ncbi:MAG: hypothetical protein K2J00_05720 [Bacteroidaceae bacterium]|nr:hypothetical protein [Bacteroidaceae bacterium]